MNVLEYERRGPENRNEPKPRTRDAVLLVALFAGSVISFAISWRVQDFDNQWPCLIFFALFLASDIAMAVMLIRWRKQVYLGFAIPAWIWFWFGVVMALWAILSFFQ
jgi:hypothetical protein